MKKNLLLLFAFIFLIGFASQPSVAQNSKMQSSTVQNSTAQSSTVQSSKNLKAYNSLIDSMVVKDFKSDVQRMVNQGFKDKAMVFVGSSTFAKWNDLDSTFARFNAVNRGFGGSSIDQVIYYGEELIFSHNPSVVVLYIGDNDMYRMSLDEFKNYFNYFVLNLRHRLPDCDLVLLSIKPSPARICKFDQFEAINSMEDAYATFDNNIYFVDIWSSMTNNSEQYFQSDQLHLNEKGYQLITKQLTPLLEKLSKPQI